MRLTLIAAVRSTVRARLRVLAAVAVCLCACSAGATARAGADDACPDANLMPRTGDLDRVRAAVLCLVNQERTSRGESPLRANGQIEHAAQNHTEDMAFGDYFDHVGSHGDTPLRRLRSAGYAPSRGVGLQVGENIAWGTLYLATPRAIVAAWMASAGHRANILDRGFRDTAIGVSAHPPASLADGQAGAIYTQDFGAIVKGGAARYNLRPLTTTRRRKGHGSTRRQVRHRHRVGARHRARHRRAVRRRRRAGSHKRPRR